MTIKQPMLASPADLDNLKFPYLASPKIDGVRCVMQNGVAMSRSMKPIPNQYVQSVLSKLFPSAQYDGELVVGSASAFNCMQTTTSGVMRRTGEPDFTFFVFDDANPTSANHHFSLRIEHTCQAIADLLHDRVEPLWHTRVTTLEQLLEFEERCLKIGYEGVMLRDPFGKYKYGRATTKENIILKVKRFIDGEAEVIGVEELMRNQNEQTRNETGHAQRSSAKEGLVGGGVLGALRVRDLKSGVEFSIGSGFDARDRQVLWRQCQTLGGKIVKYKSFKIGEKDAPRFPVFQGFRDSRDM